MVEFAGARQMEGAPAALPSPLLRRRAVGAGWPLAEGAAKAPAQTCCGHFLFASGVSPRFPGQREPRPRQARSFGMRQLPIIPHDRRAFLPQLLKALGSRSPVRTIAHRQHACCPRDASAGSCSRAIRSGACKTHGPSHPPRLSAAPEGKPPSSTCRLKVRTCHSRWSIQGCCRSQSGSGADGVGGNTRR